MANFSKHELLLLNVKELNDTISTMCDFPDQLDYRYNSELFSAMLKEVGAYLLDETLGKSDLALKLATMCPKFGG